MAQEALKAQNAQTRQKKVPNGQKWPKCPKMPRVVQDSQDCLMWPKMTQNFGPPIHILKKSMTNIFWDNLYSNIFVALSSLAFQYVSV